MKKSLVKILFVFAIVFTFFTSAIAWDDTGHKLAAYIAWEQMSPEAREKAVKLLLSAPEDSDLSVFYLQDSRSAAAKQRELFMIASTWADIVRDKKFKNRYEKYHQGNWHYSDTFWRETNGKVEVLNNFDEPKGKAVEQLFAFDKLLRDNSVTDGEKAIALAWILHLGGDIHQPLHTSARVTEFEPKGDQGGNLFELTPKDTPREDKLNLHWYWDSIIGRNIPRVNDACDSEYLPAIAQEITKKFPFAKMRNRLKLGKFDEWQQEGFQIASTKLYPPTLKRYEKPSDEYKKTAFNIAEEQIALAGYRLGQMLNKIFDNREITRENFEKEKSKYEKQANESGETIGQGVDDAWLWFKTRAALIKTEDLRDSTIVVDVENSVVTLRGSVRGKVQKEIAAQVVKEIDGVKAIKNLLKIILNR
jgi:hypothetical protein